LLDRIDLHIEVPSVPLQELSAQPDGRVSAAMREQVNGARTVQQRRFGTEAPPHNHAVGLRPRRSPAGVSLRLQRFSVAALRGPGVS
jgi:magnesium chelatase family protein